MTTAFLYKWTQLSTQMWYIGSRTAPGCNPGDGYICSSRVVKPLICNNKADWEREILAIGSSEYISILESRYLTVINAKNDPNSYNRNNSGRIVSSGMIRMHKNDINIFVSKRSARIYEQLGFSRGFSDSVKEKMKRSHADVSGPNNPMYGTSRTGIANPFYGKQHTEETKEKLRAPKTKEHKEKLSISKKGENNPNFGKARRRRVCEHCCKEIADNIYARFHGNRCKLAENIPQRYQESKHD